MSKRRLVRWLGSVVIAALLFAPNARGELAAWDQAQVTALAKELTTATEALCDTFRKKPPPNVASMQMNAYYRLKQLVRLLRLESQHFASSLESGEGREQTLLPCTRT